MRLILYTAADWLIWAVRHVMPATATLRTAEFATIRLRLLKVAARVVETTSRIHIAFRKRLSRYRAVPIHRAQRAHHGTMIDAAVAAKRNPAHQLRPNL